MKSKKNRAQKRLKEIKDNWNLRRLLNRDNELKIINKETKNRNLKIKFTTKEIDRYKKQVNHALQQFKMQTYFSIEVVDDKKLEIKFNEEKYDLDCQLCGKYVINTDVEKGKMCKEDIRLQYKRALLKINSLLFRRLFISLRQKKYYVSIEIQTKRSYQFIRQR